MRDFTKYIECELTAVSIGESADGQNVTLTILDHTGTANYFIARGVKYFALEQMLLRNYVEQIHLYDNSNLDENVDEVRKMLFYLLQGRELKEGEQNPVERVSAELMEEIRAGKKIFLEISSLYGANVLMIADQLDIRESVP